MALLSMQEYLKKKKKDDELQHAISYVEYMRQNEIAPVKLTNKPSEITAPSLSDKKDKDEGLLDFFQKGAFEDGYQFGDVTKSILGTTGDAVVGVAKGIGSLGEGIVDLGKYGVAGVADVIGKDKYAEQVRKKAQENSVEEFFKGADDYLDQYSVLGRTSDAVMQGLGQVGGIILTGGVVGALGAGAMGATVATSGLMGLSSAGSGMSEAYEGGATDGEAFTYGISKGIIDAGSELIFGGLGKAVNAVGLSKGISSLDDVFAQKLSSKLSNQVAKNFAEFGVKASAEGFEEVIAGLGSAVAKKLTYMDEEELGQIVKDENLLEQFVVGTVTSGMIQSGYIPATAQGSLKEANETGRDFITGYTQNEQAVIDKEVENRIKERETDGKKLTNKEITAIEEQVKKDLDKGYISIDTIESTLGGETYNKYKSLTEQEETLTKQLEELEKAPNTVGNAKKYEETQKLLEELKNKDEKTQIKEQLSKEVKEMALTDRLSESYNEKSRRSQAFEADLSKYDAKQQEVIKKATESGILNNTNRTHEFVDMVAKISADKGVSFDFTNNAKLKETGFALEGKTVNGYLKDGNIAVNIDSAKALNTVVGHEITHVLEGTDLYKELQNVVKEFATTKGEYQTRYDALAELYKDVDGAVIENELTADLVGEYLFTDSDFVSRLSVEKPNIFKKIYEEIKYLYKVATGSKEARQLEDLKRAFDKAYKESTTAKKDTKYSLSDTKGRNLTEEQQNYFKDSKVRDENGNLKVMYHGSPAQFTVFDKKKAKSSGYYGRGFYFSESESHAGQYGSKYEVYLDLKNPVQAGTKNITKEQLRNFVAELAENEDYGIENYGYDATVDSVTESVYGKDDFTMLGDLNATSVGDFAEAVKLFNEVNGTNYDGIIASTETVAFYPEQIKNISNQNPTDNPDINLSLGEQSAQAGDYRVYGKDIALETAPTAESLTVEEKSLPVQEKSLTNKSESLPVEYAPLTEAEANERDAMQGDRTYQDVPPEVEAPYYGEESPVEVDSPFDERDIWTIGKERKTNAYMYENPEVKPFFQQEAEVMLAELRNSIKGEKYFNDQLYYDTNGEQGWFGTKRETSEQLAYLRDNFSYNTDQLEKGLRAIIEDNGKENNAISKRIEFMLDERLREGYTDFTSGQELPPNQDYIRLLEEKQITDYSDESWNNWLSSLAETEPQEQVVESDAEAPMDEVQVLYSLEEQQQQKVTEVDGVVEAEETADTPELTVNESYNTKLENYRTALDGYRQARAEIVSGFDRVIANKTAEYNAKPKNYSDAVKGYRNQISQVEKSFDNVIQNKQAEYKALKRTDTKKATNLLAQIENLKLRKSNSISELEGKITRLENQVTSNSQKATNLLQQIENLKLRKSNNLAKIDSKIARVESIVDNMVQNEAQWKQKKLASRRVDYHKGIVDNFKNVFKSKGFDFDKVLEKAKNKGTFASVDNTPQRFIEKTLGYKAGQILNDLTVNKVAQNESKAIKWLNSYTDKKSGLLAQISKEYGIKPRSKESASAQMYAEGFWVDDDGNFIKYGDAELAQDYPNAKVRENIKRLAKDPRIRKIYDETLDMINASRTRNLYPEIPRRNNYFLHFREMDDTFSKLGIPFNPNDIRLKDLPTDINGMTADLKPGQPYFASANRRLGYKTTYDLVGGVERYLNSAKNQIYHIDDIQTLRALRNYIADTYGQAKGLESLDSMTEEEAVARIEEVYNSHLSTFAKFLNEEANVLAGKTSLTDRGLEGVIGRRGIQFLDTVNRQVGSNMVGANISSALTNTVSMVQAVAKSNKFDATKAFAQTVTNQLGSLIGKTDGFVENNPMMIRRKGIEKLTKTPWESITDKGYLLMSAIDNVSSEFIARTKYNELTRKGMSEQQAHIEADKWASRILGDRSLGQQPQLYNSKMLGLVTKFQLEVRNQLDSQFYDTIQEAKLSNEQIENRLVKNMKTSAKVGSTLFQLAVLQHMFGQAFESVAGYNPAFDIVEALVQMFGFDDDEESEDTVLDNLEEGFLTLLGDLPYTSTFTGGRVPIASALPVKQFVTGKDSYGNEKSRMETIAETAPYYLMPTGYGQLKKTTQGLGMFSDEHPVAGSYTKSGNLRFPVEDTPLNRVQAGIFGQYASENARDYFDNERSPLKEKQIQEYKDLDIPIRDYWEIREGLSKHSKLEDKADYIASLDLPVSKKNILINNATDRKEAIDMTGYEGFSDFEEFDFATKNPEKYLLTKVVGGYTAYNSYQEALGDISADKDENGKTISGSRKEKVIDYINNLDADYYEKIILFKSEYNADDTYNDEIIEYLNNRSDISYEEEVEILKGLGFEVDADGNIYW